MHSDGRVSIVSSISHSEEILVSKPGDNQWWLPWAFSPQRADNISFCSQEMVCGFVWVRLRTIPATRRARHPFWKQVYFFPEALSYPEGVEWRPKKGVESQDKAPGRRNIRLRTDCRLRTVNPWAGSHRDTWQSVIECEMYSCLPFILHIGNREHRGWRPVSCAPFKLTKALFKLPGPFTVFVLIERKISDLDASIGTDKWDSSSIAITPERDNRKVCVVSLHEVRCYGVTITAS